MKWTAHPYLVCETVTDTVREFLKAAHEKNVGLLFDYRGVTPTARDEERLIRALIERLLSAAIAATSEGDSIFFLVDAEAFADDEARLSICVLHNGAGVPAADAVILRGDAPGSSDHPVSASLRVAKVLCESMGGSFAYDQAERSGARVLAHVPVPCLAPIEPCGDESAQGAQAWLIGDRLRTRALFARRLQHMGFAVRVFSGVTEVEESLRRHDAMNAPALMIGSVLDGVRAEQLAEVRKMIATEPPLTFLCVNAAWDAPPIDEASGVSIHVMPFSAQQLAHIAYVARRSLRRPPSETGPAPLDFDDRPRALVIAEPTIGAELAGLMAQTLGYEIDFAASAGDAAAFLESAMPPAVALLGEGITSSEAPAVAARLKAVSRRQGLPTLRVLAAVADEPNGGLSAWVGTDVDGVLPWPLKLSRLAEQLRHG